MSAKTIKHRTCCPFQLALLPGVLTLAALCAPYAVAQSQVESTPGSTDLSPETEIRQYRVAAGPLGRVLSQFAEQSAIILTANAEFTDGLMSEGLNGRYSVRSALQQLLAGTDLKARFSGAKTVAIYKPVSAGNDQAALPLMTVTSDSLGSSTEGTGSYTTGTLTTATKLGLSARETPQSVSVITRQKMDDFQLNDLQDVLANTTGLSANYQDSDRTVFKSRGFEISNYQINGVTIDNDPFTDRFDAIIYDRVEVVRGSTGLLSGAGEASATINLIPKRADSDQFEGSVELDAGSWDNYRNVIDLQSPLGWDGRVRGRVVMSYQDADSYQDIYHEEKTVLYGTTSIDLTDQTLLTASLDYQKFEPRGSSWGGVWMWYDDGSRTDFPRSFVVGTDWSARVVEGTTLDLALDHQFNEDWSLKASYIRRESEGNARLIWTAGLPNRQTGSGVIIQPARNSSTAVQNTYDLSLVGKFSLLDRDHDINLGYSSMDLKRERFDWNDGADYPVSNIFDYTGDVPEPSWTGKRHTSTVNTEQSGVYGMVRLSLSDRLKLIAGGRQSRYHYDYVGRERYSQDIFTPYGGLVYDLTDSLSAYGSYTEIFSPQNYLDSSGRQLDPIVGDTSEIGLKGEWFDSRLTASFALFDTHQNNVAELDASYTPTPLQDQAYVAVDGVRSKGYELEVSGEILPNWEISASYSHHNTSGDDDGDPSSNSQPSDVARLSTTGNITERLKIGANVNWQSEDWCLCDSPNGPEKLTQKSYAIVGAMARYELSDQVSAQLNVNNLFDKKYYSQIGFWSRGVYGEPRNVLLTLKARF
ncbi:TonB-dependent siderophore receptor [Marinobacterium mangrovicola]|uniref:Outer membrane receptor for ferric coprogen and ferric-rhodotorulic acid n=1 Tax=Marinobacterium mangrovicola TaxID=1476959 RepID=A0A4R1GJW5_9GAMM|nr:TonB-dependent receptor [Marinobacterium mangrovicola]TCK07473.1 outer membrane receptor for ferric coprogen and ferric-rhodotorulic acid [Marinobacterium mangrovicola]